MPVRAHSTDAGADLLSREFVSVLPGLQSDKINTGVCVAIPEGYVGLVFSRSGQGKNGISLANSVGVIDSDYRGEISVILRNDGNTPYIIEPYKTKVAQLVIVPIVLAGFDVFNGTDDSWNNTARGLNGFGSTGN